MTTKEVKLIKSLFDKIQSSQILKVLAANHRIVNSDPDLDTTGEELRAAELLELCSFRLKSFNK